jgi:ABC-type multidrug transport system ATPase subunit
VRCVDISKSYGGRNVLHQVSFEIEAGDVVGLLGVNGAGKTTLMRVLLGLAQADAGTVEVLGRGAPLGPGTMSRVGAAIDTPVFQPWMTGRAVLQSFLHTSGVRDTGITGPALRRVGLEEKAGARVRTYSQGMRQRLALACALMRSPDVLVLDEPTNGLDPQGIRTVRQLVEEERARGCAVLVSSHQLDEIQRICDRVIVIVGGEIVAAGTIAELEAHELKNGRTLEDWFFDLHSSPTGTGGRW